MIFGNIIMLDLLMNIRVKDKFGFELGKEMIRRDLIEERFSGCNVQMRQLRSWYNGW